MYIINLNIVIFNCTIKTHNGLSSINIGLKNERNGRMMHCKKRVFHPRSKSQRLQKERGTLWRVPLQECLLPHFWKIARVTQSFTHFFQRCDCYLEEVSSQNNGNGCRKWCVKAAAPWILRLQPQRSTFIYVCDDLKRIKSCMRNYL